MSKRRRVGSAVAVLATAVLLFCMWSKDSEAAVTLVINGVSQTVSSGDVVAVNPSDQIQIQVSGLVINPCLIGRAVSPPDVTLTLPDGQMVTLAGFVDLVGNAGGGLLAADGTISVPSTLTGLTSVGCTDISVTKTDGVTSVQQNGSLTYTIVVTNNGPVADPSVSLSDAFPSLLTCTYTSVSAGGAAGNTAAGAGDIAETLSMPSGSSVTYTASCTVGGAASGSLSNTATATSSVGDTDPSNNSATDNDTAITPLTPALTLQKTGVLNASMPPQPGNTIDYTFVLANSGSVTLTNATLADPLPGLSALNCSSPLPASVAAGAFLNCTASYSITQADINAGQVVNTATADSDQTAPVQDQETVTIGQQSGLLLDKTATTASFSAVGDRLEYEYLVTNNGNTTITNPITVSDDRIAAVTCPVLPGGTLAPGGSITCTAADTVSAADILAGTVTNTAQATDGSLQSNQDIETINRDDDAIVAKTQAVIRNFMSNRADQITAQDPDLTSRLNSSRNRLPNGNPLGFSATGTMEKLDMAFATSLRTVVSLSNAIMMPDADGIEGALAYGPNGEGAPRHSTGFDIWTEGRYSHVQSGDLDSDIFIAYVGADYRLSEDAVIGLIGQFDWTDEEDNSANSSADGFGWLLGPYAVIRAHENIIIDGRFAWGESYNNVNPLGLFEDEFDTERWLVKGQVTGDFRHDNWVFNPAVALIYFQEEQKAYIDSLNNPIPSQTIKLGRMTFGPKISHRVTTPDGITMAPHISIKGIWDFEQAERVNAQGVTADSTDIRARIEGGITIDTLFGWMVHGAAFYDGIGASGLDAYGGEFGLVVPLN